MECMSFLEFPCCCSFAKAETDLEIKVVFITMTVPTKNFLAVNVIRTLKILMTVGVDSLNLILMSVLLCSTS